MRQFIRVSLPLTLAGVCFSGYLSAVKLFSGNCAFGEACPVFLGYPACYFGFVIFALMFMGTMAAFLRQPQTPWLVRYNSVLAGLGVLFSGYFVVIETVAWVKFGFVSTFFGLSTCAYGFIFFIAIFLFSLFTWLRLPELSPTVSMTPPASQSGFGPAAAQGEGQALTESGESGESEGEGEAATPPESV